MAKKKSTKKIETTNETPKEISKQNDVLVIDLGASLKKGDTLTEDQIKDLLGAGFTRERLFGK